MIALDYSLESAEARNDLVHKICAEADPEQLTPKYLEILSNYILSAEKKNKKILTDNRMVTVNKRETSFQGLACRLENGEDGIYGMIANDKNIIFMPKVSITEADVAEILPLRELRLAIDEVEEQEKDACGKKRYLLKKQLIEMRKDQYIIKNTYRRPIYFLNAVSGFSKLRIDENITIDEKGNVQSDSMISLLNPKHISALLCNYAKLKEEVWGNFESDSYYLLADLETLIDKSLKEKEPFLFSLLIHKIDGKSNAEIQELLFQEHGKWQAVEYLSSLWRNRIPKIIAEQAEKDYLTWYYSTQEYGKWKRCSGCGEYKLASNKFFTKNNTSKDGFYSLCKDCRKMRRKGVAPAHGRK